MKVERVMAHERMTMPAALIMAGGRSSRMRATKGPTHKALVPVLGVPMLERNLLALFGQGFEEVAIAIAADEPSIAAYLETRGDAIARAFSTRLRLILEEQPLGTIGAAREFAHGAGPLLIVNVDNLSAIDLRALVQMHEKSGAALTVAVHREKFTIPFGEVAVEDGFVVEYKEKPDRTLLISSGTYVLEPRACAALSPDQAAGIPQLIEILKRKGERIAAYEHSAPWIDVNDAAGVERAEDLIARNSARFAWETPRR